MREGFEGECWRSRGAEGVFTTCDRAWRLAICTQQAGAGHRVRLRSADLKRIPDLPCPGGKESTTCRVQVTPGTPSHHTWMVKRRLAAALTVNKRLLKQGIREIEAPRVPECPR